MRRFDPAALVAGVLFVAVSGLYFGSGFDQGRLAIPVPWVVAGLLIGLGAVGILRTVFRRRDS